MAQTRGSKTNMNKMNGYAGALIATNQELNSISTAIQKAALVYNPDTEELRIATADTVSPQSVKDHKHPFTHAPLVHYHLSGMNVPWRVGNPMLWYRDDLPNHPELCPLEGQTIPDEAAEHLSLVYPGITLITNNIKSMTSKGFENDDLILSVDSFGGNFDPGKLFGDEVNISNFATITDQWLVAGSELSPQEIRIEFKSAYPYRPDQYWMMPAAGTSTEVLKVRPTPKCWTVSGSNDGTTYEVIDTRENVTDWAPCTVKTFSVNTLNCYKYLKINITEWNRGEEVLEPGLRRLWIFGREANVFHLPDVPSPHPDFVWVVPYKDLNTSMLNEDVGDIGTTAIPPQNLPHYRIPTDGRLLNKNDYPDLFAAIGWTYDSTATTPVSITGGTMDEAGTCTIPKPGEITVSYDLNDTIISGYKFTVSGSTPKSWYVDGIVNGQKVTLHTVLDAVLTPGVHEFNLDTNVMDLSLSGIEIVIFDWSGTAASTLQITVSSHTQNTFRIPNIPSQEGTTHYIVCQRTPHDIPFDVVQRLQQNMIALAQSHANLEQQLATVIKG